MLRRHFTATVASFVTAGLSVIGADFYLLEREEVPVTIVEREMMNIDGPSCVEGITCYRDPEVINSGSIDLWLNPQSVEYGAEYVRVVDPERGEEVEAVEINEDQKVELKLIMNEGGVVDIYIQAAVDTGIFSEDLAGIERVRVRADG